MKVELSYKIFSKDTGKEVKRGTQIFDSIEMFYTVMEFRYGFCTRLYSFVYSGREISIKNNY